MTADPSAPPPDDPLSRLVDAGLASCAEAAVHVLARLHGLVTVVQRALLPPPIPEPTVDVRVEGRPGDRVPCRFTVENRYDRPVEVALRAGPLSAPGLAAGATPAVAFEPARLCAGPGGTEVVTAVLEVVPPPAPGSTYGAALGLAGLEGRRVGVALTVVDGGRRGGTATRPLHDGPAALPAVTIDRTPANDVAVALSGLSGLGLGGEAERALADPVAFLRAHRAEARLVAWWLEGRAAATAAPAEPAPSRGAASRRRGPTPAEELRRSPSLLR